jgi:hypothetical protein
LWQHSKRYGNELYFFSNTFIAECISFSGMLAEEITLGMRVRYPRTGTTGTILRIEEIRGGVFAELDSTTLLYRIDNLIPASGPERTEKTVVDDAKKVIEGEKEFASGSDLWKATDQSCEGGG